ncbi:hypothetical protein GCM10027614_53060 [Micromonospora vulcania]
MPAPVTSDVRRQSPLLTVLFWAGVGLAPVAALILLVADGNTPLRFAAVLAITSVVLIGLSVALRPDGDGDSVRADELQDELEELRRELRGEIVAAAQRGNQAIDQAQRAQEAVAAVRRRLDATGAALAGAAPNPAGAAPAPEPAGAGRARVLAAEPVDEVPAARSRVPVPGNAQAGRGRVPGPQEPAARWGRSERVDDDEPAYRGWPPATSRRPATGCTARIDPPPTARPPALVNRTAPSRHTGRAWSGTPRRCTSRPGTRWWTVARPSRADGTAAGTPASGPRPRRSGPEAAARKDVPGPRTTRGVSGRTAPDPGTPTTAAPVTTEPVPSMIEPVPVTTVPGTPTTDPGAGSPWPGTNPPGPERRGTGQKSRPPRARPRRRRARLEGPARRAGVDRSARRVRPATAARRRPLVRAARARAGRRPGARACPTGRRHRRVLVAVAGR